MQYTIRKCRPSPSLESDWNHPDWKTIPLIRVDHFHAKSSAHRPLVQAKLQFDDRNLYVFFRVEDRYVKSEQTELNSPVCRDSCVEFFVQPRAGKGYLNFEINCGGTMLVRYNQYIDGKRQDDPLPREVAEQVRIHPSMARTTIPEITEPIIWTMRYSIPFSLFERYVGPLGRIDGQKWKANFFKCADATSHPHWATWSPIGEVLSFHQPQYFAPIIFEA